MKKSVISDAKKAIKENLERLEKLEQEKQKLIQRYKIATEEEKPALEEEMNASTLRFKKLAEDTEKLSKKIADLKN